MKNELIPRCSNCAYVNPDDASNCGMCGCRLAPVYPDYEKRRDKGNTWEKSIITGTILEASGYGSMAWQREVWRMVGLGIVFTVMGMIAFSLTSASIDNSTSLLFWQFFNFFLLSFFLGAGARVCLDAVRDRRVEFTRAVIGGFKNILPAAHVVFWVALAATVTIWLAQLWFEPVTYLEDNPDVLPSGPAAVFMMVWLLALLVLLILPVSIWLLIGSILAMCRVLDRKSNPWLAPFWAVKQIARNHWPLFQIGFGQVFGQIIGIAICGIGLLGTIPMSGAAFAAIYEWIRLHGENPDEY